MTLKEKKQIKPIEKPVRRKIIAPDLAEMGNINLIRDS
jgi:hypothetical protein